MNDRTGALYIRVSTEDQTELSPDAQKGCCWTTQRRITSLSPTTLSFQRVYPAGMCRNVLSSRK